MTDTDTGDGPDLRPVLPRIMQLGNVLNRSGLMERAMERAAPTLDRPAVSILVSLRLSGRALRVGEIAERMQVAGPHVTRHVQVLERRRLVRRLADADDRRARLIESTPEGAEIADRYLRTMLGWIGEALDGWSAEDRKTFYRLLQRFTDDLAARLSVADDQDDSP
ncbi:MarR family winged helix-turn-helix transcriptional regulator [Amycolatopsis pigmentata]|uniref:MarR family winged helix-turn-helix transcriptional regulator n=1 Tax=Amycolatopsis pigmentata TaxID=450801 RepID=A0ABW5G0Q9_9PSEU